MAAKAKEMQAVQAARRLKSEGDEQQRKLKSQDLALQEAAQKEAARKDVVAQKAAPSGPAPGFIPEGAKGDGFKKCLVCGFKAENERHKQVHIALQGHAGFYDKNGNLPRYHIESKGGG